MFTRERLTRWTSWLRANPVKQHKGSLANINYTKFCCLGALCELEGVERLEDRRTGRWEYGAYAESEGSDRDVTAYLPKWLADELGSAEACFSLLGMPPLKVEVRVPFSGGDLAERSFSSAVQANDGGATWKQIADHFDAHYPCSDEQVK